VGADILKGLVLIDDDFLILILLLTSKKIKR